jgi:hypothetical protein
MSRKNRRLKLALAALALCASAPASAMRCELMFLGSWGGKPTTWFCEGEPFVSSPASFWGKFGMGMSWPNQGSHNPVAWVACRYNYYLGIRHVTWQTHFLKKGVWHPYPLDRCDFYCTGTHT